MSFITRDNTYSHTVYTMEQRGGKKIAEQITNNFKSTVSDK